MRSLSVKVREENEENTNGKRESSVMMRGSSWAGLLVHSQHRRSKSATDRNSNVFRGGFLSSGKDPNEIDVLVPSTSAPRETGSRPNNSAHTAKNMSSKHRASLEKDIEQLQSRLQQEKSMRLVLERAMGRASSTLSPGHRHFAAQTKELIAEIESLEEEVANREQHVLTMYRSIFEQSVSRPASEQNSSAASPAHPKHGSRKHPSIISSAFCSSKNFPFRPLHALVSLDESGKRSTKTTHPPPSNGRPDCDSVKIGSASTKSKLAMEKASILRTLRDHLHQCPSKLSEEMVRCMAVVYCWLRSTTSSSASSVSGGGGEKHRSPFLSRSSTNVVQPRRSVGEDQDWSGKSTVEILWISTDKSQFSHASYAISNYRVLVEQLERVDVSQMETNAQTAFWINVYNALIMHAYLAYGIPNNSLRRLALFQKAAYNIGGRIISANSIEHSIFCFRTPRVGWWLETILLAALRKKSGEDRRLSSKLGLPNSQPLVCFALCTGAFSDPVLRVYTASNVKEELEVAKKEFLQSNVVVKKSRKVFLPKMLERFTREASYGSDDLFKWVTENVDKKLRDSIQKCLECSKSGNNKKASQVMEWLPYASRFRYVFSKGLTEKPWWL